MKIHSSSQPVSPSARHDLWVMPHAPHLCWLQMNTCGIPGPSPIFATLAASVGMRPREFGAKPFNYLLLNTVTNFFILLPLLSNDPLIRSERKRNHIKIRTSPTKTVCPWYSWWYIKALYHATTRYRPILNVSFLFRRFKPVSHWLFRHLLVFLLPFAASKVIFGLKKNEI